MARIRTIKPEFFTSEQVAECSPNARLLFVGIWCFCDDQGIHPASPARVKMEVFPGDAFTKSDIEAMVAELIQAGLLVEYEAEGQNYWFVTGWKHQKIDKPTKKYPLPLAEHSPNIRRTVVEASGTDVEGKGSRKEGKKIPPNPPADAGGKRPKSERIGYPAFVQACRDVGQHPIQADDPIFGFADDARIPREFIALAWRAFTAKHRVGRKQQAGVVGWRAHFRDAVRGNWAKLWYFPKDGDEAALTTVGIALIRERDAEHARKAEQQEAA